MRAACVVDGRIEVRDVPAPQLGRGQVLVRVQACGICGSDLSLLKDVRQFVDVSVEGGNSLSVFDPDLPVVPGHEFAGTVEQTGDGVEGFSVGELVTGIGITTEPSGDLTIIGYSNDYPGGFGELVVVDASWLRRVPAGMDAITATLAEPLHVGETHVQQSAWTADRTALVIGAGTIGLGVVIALRARGAEQIVVVEPSPRRRDMARRLGAHLAVPPSPAGPVACVPDEDHGPLTIFECSGRSGELARLVRTAPHGSHLQVVASPFAPETFSPVIAQWRQLVINFGSGPVDDPYGATLTRLAGGTIDPAPFITGTVGLDGVAQAFEDLRDPEAHVKIVVRPDVRC